MPLFFIIMEHFYAEDLDELIIYRSEQFKKTHLITLSLEDIDSWNQFNEDLYIVEYSSEVTIDSPVQESYYNSAEGHEIDYRLFYSPIKVENADFLLVSRIPMIETKDLLRTLAYQFSSFIFILLLVLSFVQRFFTHRLWQPFYKSLEHIENFSLQQGKLPKFDSTNIKEFNRLNENLKHLMENNMASYKQQKQFIENASHELQTPLAILQSQLDLLLQDPQLTEKQNKVLQSLYSISSRMNRLNKNLLLLAKIENNQFNAMETIAVDEVSYELIEQLQDLIAHEEIKLEVKIDKYFTLYANKTLLEILLTNLIVNAIRYNNKGGLLRIEISNNNIIITNTGVNEPLDSEWIFTRFKRSSVEIKGNGLGLAIVKQICELHNWTIEYQYINDFQFTSNHTHVD